MKFKKIIFAIGLSGIACGVYAWLGQAPSLSRDANTKNERSPDIEKKAVAEMARFLETAPLGQLKAMNMTQQASRAVPPSWENLVPYTKRAPDGVWIAQALTIGSPLGTDEEAKKKLMENPANSAEEIGAILTDFPENMSEQRAQLIAFMGELARMTEDHSSIATVLLREAQRNPGAPIDPASPALLPQVVALTQYFRLETSQTKRYEAYKSVIDAQSDPALKQVFQRFEIRSPSPDQVGGRNVAAQAPSAPSAPSAVEAPAPEMSNPPAETAAAETAVAAPDAPVTDTTVREPSSENADSKSEN